ncbi:MAG TPA: hypothetical protein VJS39_07730 [Gemmatimonadaceae bacterium]|nr:hypothetical protein [Gemmatimonadaceae bacterium]
MSLKADTKVSQRREPLTYRTIIMRWLGILAPLAAAFGEQQLAYYLVLPACRRGIPLLLHIPPILALLIAGWVAAMSWREVENAGGWRSIDEPPQPGSGWFFGAVGVILSAMATLLIVAQWLPTLFIPACQH